MVLMSSDQFYETHCSLHIVIYVLLKLQGKAYLLMIFSLYNKYWISLEEIIIQWKKYRYGKINSIEYGKQFL